MTKNNTSADEITPASFSDVTEGQGERALAVVQDAVVEHTAPVAFGSFTNEPVFERGEVQIPRLRLMQGLSTEVQNGEARPGDWCLIGEEPKKEYTIIPLLWTRGREYRDEEDDNKKVVCRSQDGITGVGEPGGICETCPLSQWTKGLDPKTGKEKNFPPPCIPTQNYLVYVPEADTNALLQLKKTSMQVSKQLNGFIQSKRLGNFAVKLGANQIKGPRGTYSVPTVAITSVDPETLEMAISTIA